MSKVSIVRCNEYDYTLVRNSVYQALEQLGGIESYFSPGMRVVVKPNILKKCPVEQNVTTHPLVFKAVLSALKDAKVQAVVAESPGGLFNKNVLAAAYKTSGIGDVATEMGAILSFDTEVCEVSCEQGDQVKSMTFIKPAVEADAVISVAKLKTHEMMVYTGAVKNLFGVVPGVTKAQYHFRIPDQMGFGNMLVDIAEYFSPVFSVIDAVYGMEGEGPASGESRKIGAIIASPCPHTADIGALSLIGVNPDDVFTTKCAIKRGILDIDNIEFLGEPVENLAVKDFRMPANLHSGLLEKRAPSFMHKFISKMVAVKPVIPKDKCIGCCVCLDNCPAKAMELRGKVVVIDYEKCINCYCCHELCPKEIVKIHKPFLLKLLK